MLSKQPTRRNRLRRCAALLALLVLPGCASTQAERFEAQNRIKKANSHFEIGVDHLENGRYANGLRELRVAESLDPKNSRIQAGLAEAYMRKGKAVEAEAHLVRALEIDPSFHDARLNLSGLYLMIGRYADASEQSRILADDPTFPGVWRAYTNRAIAELSLDHDGVAREQLDLAIDFNKNYWPALLTLGMLEKKEGRPVESIQYFQRALEQGPAPNARAEVNYRMAEVYVSLGKRAKAVDHLMTAVAQTPDGEWGRKSEEYLKILR
jgi:Tfp pilus assembly protein PilF